MKRVAVAAAVAMLALPASALAATFNARVVRSDPLHLVLRRVDGRTVTYTAAQIAARPEGMGSARPPLAHMAGGPRSAAAAVAALDPGVLVRVHQASDGNVSLGLPSGVGTRHRVTGVVSAVSGGSILLDTAGGLTLRLRGAVGSVGPCQQANVLYHQDEFTLIADHVAPTGRRDCAA